MGQLTRWNREMEEQATRELARQLGSMRLATTVVKAGLVQIGSLHREAASEVARTLQRAEEMVNSAHAAGPLTPAQQQVLRWQTKDYLRDMLDITDQGAYAIVGVLLDL